MKHTVTATTATARAFAVKAATGERQSPFAHNMCGMQTI
jgi:hypothetical protein